jgi:hypothetical protein
LSDPGAGGGDDLDHEFTVDGTATGRTINTVPWIGAWAGDMAFNPHTGMIWQVNVGGDNCIYELDPASGAATGNTICDPAWTSTSQRGLAYDPTDDTFFVGGWNEGIVYHIEGLSGGDPGSVIEQWSPVPDIAGLAYNWEAGQLFIVENSTTDTFSQFDVASGVVVNSFTVSGFGNYVAAGLGIDCAGNLWAANQGNNNAYLIDSGVPANLCETPDVPWLSEDPVEGTVLPGEAANIDVTFTTVVTDPLPLGTYTATLRVRGNDPVEDTHDLLVLMHIIEAWEAPDPSFVSNAPVTVGDTVVFTNTTVPGIPPETTYEWSFGDGMTSTLEHPTHLYDTYGVFTVTLEACNTEGLCADFVDTVEIEPLSLYLPVVLRNF